MAARLARLILVVGLLVGGALASPAAAAVVRPPTSQDIATSPVPARGVDPAYASSYFGARYYRADIGRFTTIDPVYTWQENLVDPQRWNRYAYVRNNPLRYTDPDGRYTVECAKGVDCATASADFERARLVALGSKNAKISAAADAFGALDSKNGVRVFLQPMADARGKVNPDGSRRDRPDIKVWIDSETKGKNLVQTIVHEGVHIEDAMKGVRQGFTYTNLETETRAFAEGALVKPYGIPTFCSGAPCFFSFGPNDKETIRNFLFSSDYYRGSLNRLYTTPW